MIKTLIKIIIVLTIGLIIFHYTYDLFKYGGYDEFYTPVKVIKS